ncbi:hypothetical protein ACQPZJ_10590 [Actinoplanes sp. CA-054009]
MTIKLSVSVPDDVGAFLQDQANASAVVAEAVRKVMPEARRVRQREAALAMAAYRGNQRPADRAAERELIEESNDIALRGTEW